MIFVVTPSYRLCVSPRLVVNVILVRMVVNASFYLRKTLVYINVCAKIHFMEQTASIDSKDVLPAG